jgi:hypothetical protein
MFAAASCGPAWRLAVARHVGIQYPWARQPIRPQALREDRILHEIHATGGDVQGICDLFNMSVAGTLRYTTALEHPGLLR